MSVIIADVVKKSPASRVGIKPGDVLVSVAGNDIVDVLDYRFYQNDTKFQIEFINSAGKLKKRTIRKREEDELGLIFDTYLMDSQRSCKNKCIFCFIDQLPSGMRESLYFKDDDSRLSFLFGNYITLTNITEHEIERIIRLHISPVNISVHTTNPELRVRMMKNKNAGKVLDIIDRFNDAGITMNCQLVLCPGINDGIELENSLKYLTDKENIRCIAAVPVGLTDHRDGLEKLMPYCRETAEKVLDITDKFGDICLERYGERRVFAADEFYILSQRNMPDADFYEDFLQLENGVGLSALFKSQVIEALKDAQYDSGKRKISLVTGVAAYPLIKELVGMVTDKFSLIECNVYAIRNDYFGHRITVAGLVTGTDIIKQLTGCDLGDELLIPSSMLRHEKDKFLDDITTVEIEDKLSVKVVISGNSGEDFIKSVIGSE